MNDDAPRPRRRKKPAVRRDSQGSVQRRKRKKQPDSRPRRENDKSNESDPLGKLIRRYEMDASQIVGQALFVALFGIGVLVFAGFQTGEPRRMFGLIAAGLICLAAAAWRLLTGVRTTTQSVQLRRDGIRYLDNFGVTHEVTWGEVVDVEIERYDEADYGIATVERTSDDYLSPSGLTTSTEFAVRIHVADGRTVHLDKRFLNRLRDPKSLLADLKLRSGI